MYDRLKKLVSIHKKLASFNYDSLPMIVYGILRLYFEDIHLGQNKNNPFIIGKIDSKQTLIFFVKITEEIYTKYYGDIIRLTNVFDAEKVIIVFNENIIDDYILSLFPIDKYTGIGLHDLSSVLSILILEDRIILHHNSCPICNSKEIKPLTLFNNFFYDDTFDLISGKRCNMSKRLNEHCADLLEIGLSFRCKCCCEEYEIKDGSIEADYPKFKTIIPKDEYFSTIEAICGPTIKNIIWENKKNALCYYKEDLENILALSISPIKSSMYDNVIENFKLIKK